VPGAGAVTIGWEEKKRFRINIKIVEHISIGAPSIRPWCDPGEAVPKRSALEGVVRNDTMNYRARQTVIARPKPAPVSTCAPLQSRRSNHH
jgi:hypothetical protein